MADQPRYFVPAYESAKLINRGTWFGGIMGLLTRHPAITLGGAAVGSAVGYADGKQEEKHGSVVSPPSWLNMGTLAGLALGIAALGPMAMLGWLVVGIPGVLLGLEGAALAGMVAGGVASVLGGVYYGSESGYKHQEKQYEIAKRIGTPLEAPVPAITPESPSQLAASYHKPRERTKPTRPDPMRLSGATGAERAAHAQSERESRPVIELAEHDAATPQPPAQNIQPAPQRTYHGAAAPITASPLSAADQSSSAMRPYTQGDAERSFGQRSMESHAATESWVERVGGHASPEALTAHGHHSFADRYKHEATQEAEASHVAL